ncbi:MAG TPA: response regulator [Roseiflexaceae bacterium]|nr:response regulator [Roseiflexaceae bacterium]
MVSTPEADGDKQLDSLSGSNRASAATLDVVHIAALIVTDTQQRITHFNQGAELLFATTATEVCGQPLSALFPQLAEANGAEGPQLEQRLLIGRRANGVAVVVGAEVARVAVAHGCLLTILIPQTHPEQLPSGQVLTGPVAQRVLLHAVQDAVIVTDSDRRILDWNPAAEALYGWSATEVLGKAVGGILTTQYENTDEAQVLEQFLAQGVWKGEVIQRHRDGHPIAIQATVALVRGTNGKPIGLIAINRDIGARKQAEAELRAYATRLELLTEASRAFAEHSLDYTALLERVVQHIAQTLGCVCTLMLPSDDKQWLLPAALHDVDPEALAFLRTTLASTPIAVDNSHPLAEVFRSGQPQFVPSIEPEQLRTVLDPQFWPVIDRFHTHSRMLAPLQAQGQVIGVLGLARRRSNLLPFTEEDFRLIQNLADRAALAIENARLFARVQRELAEREQAERALAAERAELARRVAERTEDLSLANAELARAARLKDEFLATMSHELRTPLNSILGLAQVLEEAMYGPVTPDQIRALHSIAESGQHLLALINDILDLSKIETGRVLLEHSEVDVDMLCAMCLRMVKEAAVVKRLTLTQILDGQAETLHVDERRLRQILVNLLSNAVKFTPEGGTVGLEVRGDAEQGTIAFTVWDTGVGIAAEDLPKLFRPFVQLDSRLNRQYTGTGLGLALVLRLAKAHGGSVAVESTPGQGSRFRVTLPWSPATPAHKADNDVSAVETALPVLRQALAIEDSASSAAQIARHLGALDVQTAVHPRAGGAVERAARLQPDLILLDILLPDGDSWEVLRRLKAEPRTRQIPVLVVSVVDEPVRAREAGAEGLLLKPINRTKLVETLSRHFALRNAAPAQPEQTQEATQPRPRILLAEDNEANIAAISDYLVMKGYEVLLARNGSEAVAQTHEQRPDLILMDIQMPGMDGLEATRQIRANAALADIPIIALTALAMPGDRERCLAAGAREYLTKPVHLRTLLATIEAHSPASPDGGRSHTNFDQAWLKRGGLEGRSPSERNPHHASLPEHGVRGHDALP